ncbi:hypothetical protein HJG60_012263 [Phyllostomus discolor]|uniref:Uncharacterized protein n=1 Tax=Phyllostomus discolor TaxID=89673 RepID=A0A833Z6E9_9CHIR|nr:hypothetical protein HJG60_012263 [Phyllostomus discolor]
MRRVAPKRETPNGCCACLNPRANLPLQPISSSSHNWPQLPAFWAGVALWCGANYPQALLDPITNPHLGLPSCLHPVTVSLTLKFPVFEALATTDLFAVSIVLTFLRMSYCWNHIVCSLSLLAFFFYLSICI